MWRFDQLVTHMGRYLDKMNFELSIHGAGSDEWNAFRADDWKDLNVRGKIWEREVLAVDRKEWRNKADHRRGRGMTKDMTQEMGLSEPIRQEKGGKMDGCSLGIFGMEETWAR